VILALNLLYFSQLVTQTDLIYLLKVSYYTK